MHALWMLASGLAFALMGVCVKLASVDFSAGELVFWRSAVSVVATALLLWRRGLAIRTTRFGMHTHRGVAGFTSLFMFFYALTHLPVATAMTLNYTSPLFVAILFAVLARERVGLRLAAPLAVGFAGALLLLRPSVGADQIWPALVGLGSGAMAAIAFWNVRKLVQAEEPEERVVFYFALYCVAGALVWMIPQPWHAIATTNVLPLAGVACFGTAGQIFLTYAYGRGRAMIVATLSYSGIVFSAILGLVVFDEHPPLVAWIGMALIVAAGIIVLRLQAAMPSGGAHITND
jgi:S-adenosylmethionine uptake transporter